MGYADFESVFRTYADFLIVDVGDRVLHNYHLRGTIRSERHNSTWPISRDIRLASV